MKFSTNKIVLNPYTFSLNKCVDYQVMNHLYSSKSQYKTFALQNVLVNDLHVITERGNWKK